MTRHCRLVPIIAAAVLATSCGSSRSTPVSASASSTTPATIPGSAGSTTVATASAPPGSTVAPGATTTTSIAPAPTTTSASAPLPLNGTGVRGRVTAGPTCPVERADQPCPPRPVQGTVTAIDGNSRTTATTDSDGRYAIGLPPGRYTLHVTTANSTYPRCQDTPVTITQGPPATADIHCDTGIR